MNAAAAMPWPRKRLKFCASYNDEVLTETTDDFKQIDYIEISDVSLTGGIEKTTPMLFHEAPSRARRKVRSGDILISTVRTYLKAIAAVETGSDDLIASTGFCVVRPSYGLHPTFAGWVAKSEEFVSEIVARSVGVSYPAINASQLVDVSIPLPPLETQKRIAAFLDEKAMQIDGLIAQKQALLERLAEKRQAIIIQAVTKGLNVAAPMKESGIDWLGKIPAHWEIKPLKWLASIWGRIGFRGYTVNDIVSEGDGALSLSPSNIIGDRINFDTKTHISWEKYHESPEIKVRVGDVLFVKTGSTIGKVCLVTDRPEPMTVNPQVVVLKVHAANALFLTAAMSSAYFNHQVRGCIFGGSTPAMTQYNLGSLKIAVPPAIEQESLAEHIARSENKQLNAKREVELSIKMLAEYRSALITAAIKGEIEGLL